MLTNTFSFENGYLVQIDDILAKKPTPVPPVPPGPTPTVDPIEQVELAIEIDGTSLLISADGDLSTLDHYEINVYVGGAVVKTFDAGKSTTFDMGEIDKVVVDGDCTIDCIAVSTYGNKSPKSKPVKYTATLAVAPMTLRFEFSKQDYDPVEAGVGIEAKVTWAKLSSTHRNIWDWTNTSNVWTGSFRNAFTDTGNEVRVIAAGDLSYLDGMINMFISESDTPSNITYCCDLNMPACFQFLYVFKNSNLKATPNLILKSNYHFVSPFEDCKQLETINSVTGATPGAYMYAFKNCVKAKYGIYEMYEAAVAAGITSHYETFKNCGIETAEGREALSRIPQSWGGLAEG